MALLLGLAMLPAGAIAMQLGLNAVDARQTAYEEALSRRAMEVVSATRAEVDVLREMLRALTAAPQVHTMQGARCEDWLRAVIDRYPSLVSIALTDNDARTRCAIPSTPAEVHPVSDAVRMRAAERNEFAVGHSSDRQTPQRPVLSATQPMRDSVGRAVGFVSATVEVAALRRALESHEALRGARAVILDYDGDIIAEAVGADGAPMLPAAQALRAHFGEELEQFQIDDGHALVAPLHAPDLFMAMAWGYEQPAWQRSGAVLLSVMSPVLIWLLAIGAGWFAIEIYVARPLSNLEAAARSFARGEDVEEPRLAATAPDEIRSLRRTLAAMAKTLRGREQRLIEALAEERALLREVHHRVKNNLQMVASLLNIQARGANDESEAWGLARAHDRVQLLALVHQRIYASGEVRGLRIDDLAADIGRHLLQSRGQGSAVQLQFDCEEVRADADRAVPLAFLIGESIAGALDALDGRQAELSLALRQDDDGEVRLALTSNVDVSSAAPGPSGRLIDAFARQLGARIGRDPERPLQLWVRVPPAPS